MTLTEFHYAKVGLSKVPYKCKSNDGKTFERYVMARSRYSALIQITRCEVENIVYCDTTMENWKDKAIFIDKYIDYRILSLGGKKITKKEKDIIAEGVWGWFEDNTDPCDVDYKILTKHHIISRVIDTLFR